ncbi:acetyltransferase [uncultured Gammaproteobacteria bacterium]
MAISTLDHLLNPASIAVVGASLKPNKLGSVVMRGLLAGNFQGPILPVHPRHRSVAGVLCYHSVADLPVVPDLAVLCTPPHTIVPLLSELGRRGTRAAIVMSIDTPPPLGGGDSPFARSVLEAARAGGVRLLGPASLGLQVPAIGLNASWLTTAVRPGRIALLSQSGSLMAGVVEWAHAQGIGFSHVISVGDAIDLDIGDFLDYLGSDVTTQAILVYVRNLANSRKFLSAARAAARFKRVIVIKAGHQYEAVLNGFTGDEGGQGALRPDGGIDIHPDEAFDAAIRRAGLLRVHTVDELFDAVETLASVHTVRHDRLAVICNGSGPAALAADALLNGGGKLAPLTDETRQILARELASPGEVANPVDICRDATPDRFARIARLLLDDPTVGSLLVMHTPTVLAASETTAKAVIDAVQPKRRSVLACWLGESERPSIHALFSGAGIPVYVTPDKAARGFLHLVRYHHNQQMLLQTPIAGPGEGPDRKRRVATLLLKALGHGRKTLDEAECRAVMQAYGIPMAPLFRASSAEEAEAVAERIGFPVAVRLLPAGGEEDTERQRTAINLWSSSVVRSTVQDLLARFQQSHPWQGPPEVGLHSLSARRGAVPLGAGVGVDALFGPMIRFGTSALRAQRRDDHALGLPPLNMHLAGEMIGRTEIGRDLLRASDRAGAALPVVQSLLVNLSHLIVDHPEIAGVTFDPMIADNEDVAVVHASIRLIPAPDAETHLAIRPYPSDLEEWVTLPDGNAVFMRPILPEDTPAYERMLRGLTLEDMRMRFQGVFKSAPASQLAALVHIDYDRDMTIVAVSGEGLDTEILGSVNLLMSARSYVAEYAILLRSDQKKRRLGQVLMDKILRYAHERQVDVVTGLVHRDNAAMLHLCRNLGFHVPSASFRRLDDDEGDMITVTLDMTKRPL